MLEWKIGIETNLSLSVGKNSKYLERYVNKDIWESLLKTYPNGEYKQVWNSLL